MTSLVLGVFTFILLVCVLSAIIVKATVKTRWLLSKYSVLFLFLFCILFIIIIPFSPSYDSYDMLDFLNRTLNGEKEVNYFTTIYSFYVTNKIVAYFYLLFCKIFNSTVLGVKVCNFLCMFISIYCISGSFDKLTNASVKNLAMPVIMFAFPVMILSGPYNYPVSILLSSICFWLYLSDNKALKLVFFPFLGLLFVIRMTAGIYILVFLFFQFFYSCYSKENFNKKLSRFAVIIAVLIFCFVFKAGSGYAIYKTGLHKYPSLQNSAFTWTYDIGTRLDGERTGRCTYSPYTPLENDEISSDFATLWSLYSEDNSKNFENIKALNSKINEKITLRSMNFIKTDPKNILMFVFYKTANLLLNVNRPYYYEYNYNSQSLSDELFLNIQADYFLLENNLLLAFLFFSCMFATQFIRCLFTKTKLIKADFFVMSLILGVLANTIVFILFTEVMKRYLFDAFVPISLVIVLGSFLIGTKIQITSKQGAVLLACLTCIFILSFNLNNNWIFFNSKFLLVNNNTEMSISLNEASSATKIVAVNDDAEIPLTNNTLISVENNKTVTIILNGKNIFINGFKLKHKK